MANQFENKQYDPAQFGSKQFPGGGAVTPVTPGSWYATRNDIELIYGKTNVFQWADVDNNENETDIDARIEWALKNSYYRINDRLNQGPYTVPFVTPFPNQVIVTSARMAGIELYDSRGITDFAETGIPKHMLFYHVQMVEKFFVASLANQLFLVGQETTKNVPGVYDDSSSADASASEI